MENNINLANLISILFAQTKSIDEIKSSKNEAIIFGDDGSLHIKSVANNFDKTIIPAGAQFSYNDKNIIEKFVSGVQGHQADDVDFGALLNLVSKTELSSIIGDHIPNKVEAQDAVYYTEEEANAYNEEHELQEGDEGL